MIREINKIVYIIFKQSYNFCWFLLLIDGDSRGFQHNQVNKLFFLSEKEIYCLIKAPDDLVKTS